VNIYLYVWEHVCVSYTCIFARTHTHTHSHTLPHSLTHCHSHRKLLDTLCRGCGGAVSGESLSALGALWHKTCFVCTTCRCDLSQGFVEWEGKPYCGEHYSAAQSPTPTQQQLPQCGGCGQGIEGSHLKAAGRTWHPEHFLCGNCHASLQNGFAEVNGFILCGGCAIAFSSGHH
jgi:LIM domain